MSATPPSLPSNPAAGGGINVALAGQTVFPYTDTLPAAGQVGATKTLPMAGQRFYVFSATGPVTIQPLAGDAFTYPQGTGLNIAPAQFTGLQIGNPNPVPITFTILVSFAGFIDQRLVFSPGSALAVPVQNAPTKCIGNLGVAPTLSVPRPILAPESGLVIAGNLMPNGAKRKQLIVHNLETPVSAGGSGNQIIVFDNSAPPCILDILNAGQDWIIETSDVVNLFNANASNTAYSLAEIYYTF